MKWARVSNNVAVEVINYSPEIFNPEVTKIFIEVPDETESGDIWDGQSWHHPPTQPEPEPGSVVPYEITNWQAKKQLIIEGVYEQVNAAISTMDVDAQVDWNHAAVFKRNYPLILQMQTLLGRTDADTDAYFIAAGKLS